MSSQRAEGGPAISPQREKNRESSESSKAEPDLGAGGRQPGGTVPPWVKEGRGAGEESSFGSWLRRQREMREIDLREIADRTKISLRYLKAMEQDRFDLLPAAVFAKGFLREYAKYVGLNADEVVNFYLSAHAEAGGGEAEEHPPAPGAGSSSPWTWGVALALAAVLALALVAYLAFYAESRRGDRTTAPAPIAPPPAAALPAPAALEPPPPAAAAPASAATSAPLEVTLDFTQECWVEVVMDGRDRISELHVQGESLQLPAQRSVVFSVIGNPAGVEVQVNGMPFPLPVAAGRLVRDLRIDLDTVERLRTATPR